MSTIDKMFAEDERCSCGRTRREIHCPDCGSLNVEGKTREVQLEILTNEGPKRVWVKAWRCRRCGYRFTDKERFQCGAPTRALSMRAQRVVDAIPETVKLPPPDTQERKDFLDEMFGGKRLKPRKGE